MPWEVYERPKGYRDLVYAMASLEGEEAAEQARAVRPRRRMRRAKRRA